MTPPKDTDRIDANEVVSLIGGIPWLAKEGIFARMTPELRRALENARRVIDEALR